MPREGGSISAPRFLPRVLLLHGGLLPARGNQVPITEGVAARDPGHRFPPVLLTKARKLRADASLSAPFPKLSNRLRGRGRVGH